MIATFPVINFRRSLLNRFSDLINTMTGAIVAADADTMAACFTPHGVYHDVFYGPFRGPELKTLVLERFHRDGTNFRWDIHDPVAESSLGYARYVFSYDSRLSQFAGQRVVFEGVAICKLEDGLISDYREVANAAAGLQQLGFNDQRLAKFVKREAGELLSRQETVLHLGAQAEPS